MLNTCIALSAVIVGVMKFIKFVRGMREIR